ncbi:MAG: hypothetical protein ACXWZL_08925 [Mycobacterium sp.]
MTDTWRRATDGMSRNSRRAALAAVFALTVGLLLLALPGTHAVWTYWAASAVALVGALVLIVVGERAWDHMLANARAAGVVAPN